MANESLSAAKAAKNEEFYTQYYDIERLDRYIAEASRRLIQYTKI